MEDLSQEVQGRIKALSPDSRKRNEAAKISEEDDLDFEYPDDGDGDCDVIYTTYKRETRPDTPLFGGTEDAHVSYEIAGQGRHTFPAHFGTDIIVVNVKDMPFNVHKDLICNACDYFQKCFSNDRWAETADGSINMPEDDPNAFILILQWLYKGRIVRDDNAQHVKDLISLYILSEKICLEELCVFVIGELQSGGNSSSNFQKHLDEAMRDIDLIKRVCADCIEGSRLRTFIAAYFAYKHVLLHAKLESMLAARDADVDPRTLPPAYTYRLESKESMDRKLDIVIKMTTDEKRDIAVILGELIEEDAEFREDFMECYTAHFYLGVNDPVEISRYDPRSSVGVYGNLREEPEMDAPWGSEDVGISFALAIRKQAD